MNEYSGRDNLRCKPHDFVPSISFLLSTQWLELQFWGDKFWTTSLDDFWYIWCTCFYTIFIQLNEFDPTGQGACPTSTWYSELRFTPLRQGLLVTKKTVWFPTRRRASSLKVGVQTANLLDMLTMDPAILSYWHTLSTIFVKVLNFMRFIYQLYPYHK